MPNTYQYVNQQGTLSTVNANSSAEALANAQNRASDSGVQLLTTPQAPAPSQTPTINPVVANTPVAPTPPAITPQGLQNQTPINVATFTPAQPPVQPNQAADALFQQTQVEDSALQQQSTGISTAMADAIAKLTGQQQELAAQQQIAGVGAKKQELNALSSQILQKQAEINQSDIQLIANQRAEERRDTLLPFAQMGQAKLAGDAAILRALKTSEVGVLNAQVLAKQGDIALAQEAAQQAVDLKYAPYKEFIAVAEAQLKALEPLLSREEKKQAEKQKIRAEFAMKEIDKISSFQKTALSNAISNNAPQSIIDKINNSNSVEEISAIGGRYLISKADQLDNELKSLQIRKVRGELNGGTGENLKELLSIKEAQDAGVPYGTTKAQLINMGKGGGKTSAEVQQSQNKLDLINGALANTAGLRGVVGPNPIARAGLFNFNIFTGVEGDFIASINQLTNQETLSSLLNLKKAGGTLGALSEGEGKLLAQAATKINSWAQKDDNGNVTGYKTTEKSFKNELNTIKRLTEKAITESGGVIDTTPTTQTKKDWWDSVDQALQNNGYTNSGYDLN